MRRPRRHSRRRGEHCDDGSSRRERRGDPRTRYALDAAEQLQAIEAIEAEGLETVGFYHSHPAGPPGPSETDAANATWPGVSYVIVVLDGAHPYVGSWRWTGEAFRQETVALR
ncbi:M67 family metallopeptidase [Haloarculaceae archaeon H-GB2-1]|nr:M67 family metallopeptidase [Haloarculaceae archaeon H-GB2-1]